MYLNHDSLLESRSRSQHNEANILDKKSVAKNRSDPCFLDPKYTTFPITRAKLSRLENQKSQIAALDNVFIMLVSMCFPSLPSH